MQYTETVQAILLLTCKFNKSEGAHIKPLTPTQYARFAGWLHQNGFTPASLLSNAEEILAHWQDTKKGREEVTTERLHDLLARGASMAFALESWAKHGIKIITRACPNYPEKIRTKIGTNRSPVFFTIGNLELLNKPSIGFVGSRDIDANDEDFTRNKAQLAASQGFVVVSGGAKGVDQTAMLAALDNGGKSIGILADSLLRTSASKLYRDGLRDNRLLLLSPFNPEAGFLSYNAMARNKYIYALAESVVVVKSETKGGTWTGATDNIKAKWAPLWVRNTDQQGNQELIKLGAQPMADDFACFNTALEAPQAAVPVTEQQAATLDMFATADAPETPASATVATTPVTSEETPAPAAIEAESQQEQPEESAELAPEQPIINISPAELFSQQHSGTYIETQAQADAYLSALKEQLQTALEQHQRINIQ